jgi:hypothetical protein
MTKELGKSCSVHEATHIKFRGHIYRIASVWGVGPGRDLAKPSRGGFGCVLEDGTRVSMWRAEEYFSIEGSRLPPRQLNLEFEKDGSDGNPHRYGKRLSEHRAE